MKNGWIGVDLDGTLAHYDGWKGELHIGEPIPAMVALVKGWLADGREVRIFTARVAEVDDNRAREPVPAIREAIRQWCRKHIGVSLPVTNLKDYGMVELWDDRAVRVRPNTGEPCCAFDYRLTLVVTTNEAGAAVCVSWQDVAGRIMKVVWEAK